MNEHIEGPALEGLDRTRAAWWRHRSSRLLAAALIFVTGFFLGAILFGCALIHSIPTQP